VEACAVSADGKLIASGGTDRTIKVWDRETGVERCTLTAHAGSITALVFTPDGKMLVSAGEDRSIRLWDPASGKELPRQPGHQQHLTNLLRPPPALGVSPDGKRLLAWVPGNERYTTVSVFDLATGQPLLSFNDQGRSAVSLTFSADGKKAAIGAKDGSVRVYDLEKRGELQPGGDWLVYDAKAGVADLVFTPDGGTLLVGNDEGDIKVCSVARREILRTFKAHDARVVVLTMSRDGKRFASAGHDNVVKLWDTTSGKELRQWDMHLPVQQRGGFVAQMCFTPDGRALVTANANTTLYLLELP
jgi:WD40 repeat protein